MTRRCVQCQHEFHGRERQVVCSCCMERGNAWPLSWNAGICPRGLEPRPSNCVCIVGEPPEEVAS